MAKMSTFINQKQIYYRVNNQNQDIILLRMEENMLDISKISSFFDFELHNEGLTNCIKQLHFTTKTQEKNLQKIKKDIETKLVPQERISDAFSLIASSIDIDSTLSKMISNRSEHQNDASPLGISSMKLGNKVGQMSDILRLLFEKMKKLQKKVQTNEISLKSNINQIASNLQGQLDELKKQQRMEIRSLDENMQININKYQEKLREVESKTLWQINDCNNKLSDRVNQQFVRDIVKETEARINTKVKQSMIKNNIEPQRIDHLQSRCLKLQKLIQIKVVEVNSKTKDLRDYIQNNLFSKKDAGAQKLETDKKIGNLQIHVYDNSRKIKNSEIEIQQQKEEALAQKSRHEESVKEVIRLGKIVDNLKISDDFQKLMENLDPHKICEIDTSLNVLEEKNLKIQRQIESVKRNHEKFKEKVEICNMLNPNSKHQEIDREEISKIFLDLLTTNTTFKKISSLEGQLYQFKGHGELINEINKRISRIQKQFDLQGVMYSIKALEEYIKKELLILSTKFGNLETSMAQSKMKRSFSARKTTSQQKISSCASFKKLTTMDCISCFQNPMGDRSPQQRKIFGKNY